MKLTEAVTVYVARRRSEGAQFVSPEIILKSMCKGFGDIELSEMAAERVSKFIRSSGCVPATVASRFSAVSCFLSYWTVRGEIAEIPLQRPRRKRTLRIPYIYTRLQIKALLDSAQNRSYALDSFDGRTMRMILLLLYATGAAFEEILSLRWADVDFSEMCIRLERMPRRISRILPIGMDLAAQLSIYRGSLAETGLNDALLVCCKSGAPIRRGNLWYRFAKLHRAAGLSRTLAGDEPRLHDLKFTFAVHRLSACIQEGGQLNRIVPALSTYLGYTSLTKAEEYLAFVPERFNDDLRKLSPTTGQTHWRNQPNLLVKLNSL
jgi:integrase/recombinase XerD